MLLSLIIYTKTPIFFQIEEKAVPERPNLFGFLLYASQSVIGGISSADR